MWPLDLRNRFALFVDFGTCLFFPVVFSARESRVRPCGGRKFTANQKITALWNKMIEYTRYKKCSSQPRNFPKDD